MAIHKLGAQTLICSMEMEEREGDRGKEGGVKEKVVELSVQSGVSSAFTAFIAVHKGDGEALQGQLLRRQVPTPNFDSPAPTSKPVRDLLLQLISLQKASGSWVLEAALSEVLAKTEEEVSKPKPAQVDQEVWATVLALVWLYGFKMEAQEDWQFVAMKAVSWIQAQKVASVSECVQAGKTLLGCQVQKTPWDSERFTLPVLSLSPTRLLLYLGSKTCVTLPAPSPLLQANWWS
eukprot:XP_014018849.1 PREDICTED: von Willebrand factor A domain-containing protein 5A-like [Salmo salar]